MKMSDALRAAAETAPVDNIHVATGTVQARTRRNRAVRVGANGVAGVGAAALVFAAVAGAVAGPTGVVAAEGDMTRNGVESPASGGGAPEPDMIDGSMLACGYKFDAAAYAGDAVKSVVTLGDLHKQALPVQVAYSTASETPLVVDVPGVYVIWDGIVVANTGVVTDAVTTTVTAAEPASIAGTTDLVNCWDGSELPAGDYTVVTVTTVSAAVDEAPPVEEPTGEEPDVTEPAATEPGASVDPDTSVSSDVTTDIAVEPVTYTVSDGVSLTIGGDAVEDPFDQYLNPTEPTQPTQPSDALTAEQARAAYLAALSSSPWDMAAGTQRVVLTSDSTSGDDIWSLGYFGCSGEGLPAGFPESSAELDWLDVTGNLPSSIQVSYGWIVDGNPLVSHSITNSTDWSLPGFYGGASPRLVLVKDGKVVAEAYPVNPDQNGGAIAYSIEGGVADGDAAKGEAADLIYAPAGDGYLAPGATLTGEFLWRDISGCWSADGPATVGPGTYTVLSSQELYVGGYMGIAEEELARSSEGADEELTVDPSSGTEPSVGTADEAPLPILAPAPDNGDFVSFTVWTSLGSLNVTN